MKLKPLIFASLLLFAPASGAQDKAWPASDIPAKFTPPTDARNYVKREAMIPMRDGTKLYTVIVMPKGAKDLPIILTRTPYNAAARANRMDSPHLLSTLPLADEPFVKAGYIRIYQDIRGKYGSEGDYVVTRPVIGPLNPTKVDHVTDAWDTIDWLANKANLPESNGRVGMIGSSYEGFTVAMALLNPHPALKVAVPESPMIDGWMGDDWFHYGAFRLANIGWIASQTGYKGSGKDPATGIYDNYEEFRRIGGAAEWAKASGFDQLPAWQKMIAHPAYDAFWQGQALDKLLAANPSNVPTLWEQGLWDQEDMYGAITAWEALKAKGKLGNNYLVMGPWRHSQINREGRSLGPLQWDGDTAAQFREKMVLPLFDQYLKDGPSANLPAATIYNTGENRWERFADWPLACEAGCKAPLTPIYLQADGGLGFARSAAGGDSYVSDPAKPVPHLPRPVNFGDGRWPDWLVSDQRHADGRTDVMTYQTEVLTEPVRLSGAPFAEIFAKTTGTDGDFVVKLIDVYPDEVPSDAKMGGYQLAISLDIFRGRYRESFEKPSPIPAGKVQRYRFRLPTVNHTFQPGHRIMVQIQSTLFPLYDRNPQKFVPNIFLAKKADYQKAMVTLERGGSTASAVWLPLVPAVP
ncbi:CocE/NonD family hydrolase [Sphingomonas koreensis]|uniref:CocE/NonD family hydrolase n=2 Tax=Sphingomonas koreensis TaxID=93064 RepID=A0A1L6JG67_9SPHN|nr:CocE/NonD family hydrolase [Sphingomonas koreensis]APR54914.1 glutaryl-7-ACA acylase [Sphingomonas koreensis]RSU18060.1 CocE/NonD family hydrolase [Sphingomonas koreensis]RSU22226.1 CocE/NonD family hydrolase [Sphingomonas koreensis]RSU23877.1 CocE/NonD family hydrolase [Sphingomonas koreensis]RSU32562.1 CocE/NonD family hydrolase [Sphingomonas koreensis]